jgi:hypothetical protein
VKWQIEWGSQVSKLLEIEQATGVTPSALLSEPKLAGICTEVVQAYNVLAARRTSGLTVNPIQLSEIKAYLEVYGDPCVPVDVFVNLIGVMDLQYMELTNGNATGGKR